MSHQRIYLKTRWRNLRTTEVLAAFVAEGSPNEPYFVLWGSNDVITLDFENRRWDYLQKFHFSTLTKRAISTPVGLCFSYKRKTFQKIALGQFDWGDGNFFRPVQEPFVSFKYVVKEGKRVRTLDMRAYAGFRRFDRDGSESERAVWLVDAEEEFGTLHENHIYEGKLYMISGGGHYGEMLQRGVTLIPGEVVRDTTNGFHYRITPHDECPFKEGETYYNRDLSAEKVVALVSIPDLPSLQEINDVHSGYDQSHAYGDKEGCKEKIGDLRVKITKYLEDLREAEEALSGYAG